MVFRCRWYHAGGHIHVRVFQAPSPEHTWQKNGDLVFDEAGWVPFRELLLAGGVEVLEDDD